MTLKRLSEFGLSLILSLSSLLVIAVPKVHAETMTNAAIQPSMSALVVLVAVVILVVITKSSVKTYSHSTSR